jgi:hypothetical protein
MHVRKLRTWALIETVGFFTCRQQGRGASGIVYVLSRDDASDVAAYLKVCARSAWLDAHMDAACGQACKHLCMHVTALPPTAHVPVMPAG